jgi:cell division septation protein DedD
VADSHRDTEDGFHEIQLTGKQLVFVFMATTVVVVVVFLLGVLVGRGVDTERTAEGVTAGSTAPDALPPDNLPPSSSQDRESSPATGEDLSYAQRLQGDDPAERLKPGTPPAADTTAEPPAVAESGPPDAPPASARGDGADWVVQVAALRDRNAASAIVRRLSGKGYRAFLVDPAAGAPAPSYRVRVGPFQDRREAEQVSRRLEREEQFKPFITR